MSSICSAFRSALKTPGSNGASPASTAQPPLIGSRILQANKQNSAHELPLQVSSLQFPSDYGLPLYTTLPRNSTNVNGTSNYSSLQPSFFPKVGGNMMPDEQYPTLPFRSPYIHTADSGPSAIGNLAHHSKSQSFVQTFNFDKNPAFSRVFFFFFDNFSREIKVVNS